MINLFRNPIAIVVCVLVFFTSALIHSEEILQSALPSDTSAKTPERIVVLYPMPFGIVFVLDLEDRIASIPKMQIGMPDNKLGKFYLTFAPGLANAVDVGLSSSPNLETLLKTDPDLVLGSETDEHSSTALKVLRENKVPILLLKGGFGSVEEWLSAINKMGKATGRLERAQQYDAFFRQRLKLVQDRLAEVPLAKRPKVALLNTAGSQMIIRGSRTSFAYDLISLAGGRLMEKGDDPAESAGCAELMFAFDPDLIIDDSKIDVFYKASWWNSLRAVQEKKVYKTPADDKQAWITNWFLSTYSPVGLLWLAKIIHPEKFKDIDLQAEHKAFCQMMYGRSFPHAGTGFAEK
ncbi:MAG: ABC transporter substrate-binding protein [Candidatus Riflebacteria bacterium]|nr:ABC transporter substrate-binding protein [Candidatus Riflebacteria bacterium]